MRRIKNRDTDDLFNKLQQVQQKDTTKEKAFEMVSAMITTYPDRIQRIAEKIAGKIPENVCVKLIEKYTTEQTELKEKITSLIQGLEEVVQAKMDVGEFIRRMKMYFNSPTFTREMYLLLFDRLIIGGKETVMGKL